LRYGLYLPNFGKASNPKTYAELALMAERVGWDGFFWDRSIEWNQRIGGLKASAWTTIQ